MDKSHYNHMQSSIETQHNNAWKFILDNWNTPTWKALPQGIKLTLGLHSAIGVCSGMLITRTGASGSQDFISRLNSKSS